MSQNLVPNPGFEDYRKLPCDLTNNDFIEDYLNSWFQPIPTSTDYWNTESPNECFFNPLNWGETPRTGNGMVGIITATANVEGRDEYKEYIEVELTQSLRPNTMYNVQFYVKSKSTSDDLHDLIECNNIGIVLSDTLIRFSVDVNAPDHLLMVPQIFEANVVKVDDGWKKISKCFVASSSSKYLLIGNFWSTDSALVEYVSNSGKNSAIAYYFIDDVSLEEMQYDPSGLITSATLCDYQPFIKLNAFIEGASEFHWLNGDANATIEASLKESHDYVVDILFKECTYRHTISVMYVPQINLGPDTVLCNGEVLKLKPAYPSQNYMWSDGSVDSVKYISTSGTYSISVSSDCIVQDSLMISFLDCPGFIPNIITPNGDNFNQYFKVENIDSGTWSLKIVNRWGQLIYFSADYQNDWSADGIGEGVYYYELVSSELGKIVKGWIQVMR
jgi:gliding motility-associated-like protein